MVYLLLAEDVAKRKQFFKLDTGHHRTLIYG